MMMFVSVTRLVSSVSCIFCPWTDISAEVCHRLAWNFARC